MFCNGARESSNGSSRRAKNYHRSRYAGNYYPTLETQESSFGSTTFASDVIEKMQIPLPDQVALRLLSLDEYGKSTRINTSGSHAVVSVADLIHCKANCELHGLNPGMEHAFHLFNNSLLFPHQELVAPTAFSSI